MSDTKSTPLAVPMTEACRLAGFGRTKMYELIKAGRVKPVKVGTKTLIRVQAIQDLLLDLESE